MLHALTFRTKIILLITAVILFFGLTYIISPIFVLATFYFEKNNILISPISENYTFIILAFVSLILGLSLLAWRKSIWTIIVTGFSIILFGFFIYASTVGYFVIHEDYVMMKTFNEEKKFQWEDLDKIKREYTINTPGTYYFIKGNETIEMVGTGQFSYVIQGKIRRLASKSNIDLEENLIE